MFGLQAGISNLGEFEAQFGVKTKDRSTFKQTTISTEAPVATATESRA